MTLLVSKVSLATILKYSVTYRQAHNLLQIEISVSQLAGTKYSCCFCTSCLSIRQTISCVLTVAVFDAHICVLFCRRFVVLTYFDIQFHFVISTVDVQCDLEIISSLFYFFACIFIRQSNWRN